MTTCELCGSNAKVTTLALVDGPAVHVCQTCEQITRRRIGFPDQLAPKWRVSWASRLVRELADERDRRRRV